MSSAFQPPILPPNFPRTHPSTHPLPTAWLSSQLRRTHRILSRIPRQNLRPLRRPRPPPNTNNGLPPPSTRHVPAAALAASGLLPVLDERCDDRLRVMLLISDTGGGHRASAQALAAAFEALYPGRVNALIVDFWTEIVGRPFVRFPQGYSFLAKNPPLWRAAWNYGRFPVTRRLTEEFANVVGNGNFKAALREFEPHLIVSVHPLTQFIPLRVLRNMPHAPPFVTVCTDLGGAHPTWFHRDVDLCFVPSDAVRRIALRCGLKQSQLRQYGLPVRPAFWRDEDEKEVVRRKLGLRSDVPTVLIVGGGDGVGGVGRIARAVAQRVVQQLGRDGAQLVVVCGKNVRLHGELQRERWPVAVYVRGFVQNMSEYMAASDMIVSKAGPGTIAESMIRGLPIVLSGFLPGQEAPNVKFVTDNGLGCFSREPDVIADIVCEWVSDGRLRERAARARQMGRPEAACDIVREVGKLVGLEEEVMSQRLV